MIKSAEAVPRKCGFWKRNRGLLYVLPWLIGFVIFKGYPFISSMYYSMLDYNLFKVGERFVGFGNYETIINTKKYMNAYGATFRYAFLTVPLKLTFSLFIAYILNFDIKFVKGFRTIYYIPSILGSSVAISVVWRSIFNQTGLVNRVLEFIGISEINWLGNSKTAIWVICLLKVWQFGSSMVIFLAALKGVPMNLYEASAIDGAGKWKQFIYITIPMITPVIFYNLVTQLCESFQEFNSAYLITKGGPLGSTTLISMLVYQNAFKSYDMGMACAMAWILFIIVGVLSAVAFLSQKYWVYYSDDAR